VIAPAIKMKKRGSRMTDAAAPFFEIPLNDEISVSGLSADSPALRPRERNGFPD